VRENFNHLHARVLDHIHIEMLLNLSLSASVCDLNFLTFKKIDFSIISRHSNWKIPAPQSRLLSADCMKFFKFESFRQKMPQKYFHSKISIFTSKKAIQKRRRKKLKQWKCKKGKKCKIKKSKLFFTFHFKLSSGSVVKLSLNLFR
jgi:hypothetical protein